MGPQMATMKAGRNPAMTESLSLGTHETPTATVGSSQALKSDPVVIPPRPPDEDHIIV